MSPAAGHRKPVPCSLVADEAEHGVARARHNLSKVASRDTAPELALRRGLHRRGYRFRTNDRRYPGTPDLVFPRFRATVFFHGCFWHAHDCDLFVQPKTRAEFWSQKLQRNHQRDSQVREELAAAGWRVYEVWECSFRGKGSRSIEVVVDEVATWLGSSSPAGESDRRGTRITGLVDNPQRKVEG